MLAMLLQIFMFLCAIYVGLFSTLDDNLTKTFEPLRKRLKFHESRFRLKY